MPYEQQFAALSHPLRQQILSHLTNHPSSVKQLTDHVSASQPVISQHLKVLKDAGFVSATPEGAKNIYRTRADKLDDLRNFLEHHWITLLTSLDENKGTT